MACHKNGLPYGKQWLVIILKYLNNGLLIRGIAPMRGSYNEGFNNKFEKIEVSLFKHVATDVECLL